MRDFKFFQRKERVFTDYMDAMDDYFLGGIQPPTRMEAFDLNVIDAAVFGRIPSYTIAIERDNYIPSSTVTGTIHDLLNGRFSIPWCFTSIRIQREHSTEDVIEINYNNVGLMNQRGMIFGPNDQIVIRYKLG